MGSGFSKMKKQARMMQQQYQKMQEDMQNLEVIGTSGSGLVQVYLNGEKQLKKIIIKPDCVDPKDVEGLQDLIVAAFEDGFKKVQEGQKDSGFNLPFG